MLTIGQVLNETYRIERLLGQGGMAQVYQVSHMRLPRSFALKLVLPELSRSDKFHDRFRREAEILARLRHPHIVDVVDWNISAEGTPYLVMELLDGEDLSSFLTRTGPLTPQVALGLARQIGEALQHAHQTGIVHRDLKPSNIFLTNQASGNSTLKVLDFGIAKLTDGNSTQITLVPSLMGTPAYMSPEQVQCDVHHIDGRTDQFALAAIFYEMITGTPAFATPGATTMQILHEVLHGAPRELPPPLAFLGPVLHRALSHAPEDRYPTIAAFISTLGAQLGQPAHSAGTLEPRSSEVVRPGQRRIHRGVLIGGAGLAFLMTLGVLLTRRSSAPPADAPSPPPSVQRESSRGVAAAPPPSVSAQPPGPPARPPEPPEPPEKRRAPAGPSPAPQPRAATTTKLTRIQSPIPPIRAKSPPRSEGQPWAAAIKGAAPQQQQAIRGCLEELRDQSGLPAAYEIVLQRSGSLHVVKAPPAVYDTDLADCLRRAFQSAEPPESVTISISRAR